MLVDVAVPDRIRIDDDDRAFVAAVQAAGLVDAHLTLAIEAQGLYALLGVSLHVQRAVIVATRLRRLALVAAEEDMAPVIAHRCGRRKIAHRVQIIRDRPARPGLHAVPIPAVRRAIASTRWQASAR